MRNRWGIEIKKGYYVFAHHPRGGMIEGKAQVIDREPGRGYVVTLDNGYTVAADDVSEVLPPMRVGRGGVVKANPAEIHIDIGSHNTKGRNVRAENPTGYRVNWDTFAGGTSAYNPEHNSYSARTPLGTLYVDPPSRRGGSWHVRFSNDLGRVEGGLWRDIGSARSAASAKKLAREWLQSLAGESAMYSSLMQVRAKNPDFTVSDFRRELKAGPYAWPGGYPRYFVMSDGEALSFKDAKENARLIMEAIRDRDNSGWRVVGVDVNWENSELYSAHSGERIESAYAENPTPRLTRYDQPSQRERISERTGRPTKTPSARLKNRRLKTHHFAPEGVWANPLTRVKLKSPAQRGGADPSPRLLKRRRVTAKAPQGFYANPVAKNQDRYAVQRQKGSRWDTLELFDNREFALIFARAYAKAHPSATIRVWDYGT